VQLLWSRKIAAPPRGLALARERGWLLVWDADRGLHLFNRSGTLQAHAQTPAPLVHACCADDGESYAAVGAGGQVWLLAPDLTPRWERTISRRGTAVALDPFGQYLAAADGDGGLSLWDCRGQSRWRVSHPRPMHHLAFVPERPALAASADFGLATCLDLSGNSLWRDGPVAHVGSLTVSGDGAVIALACFSDGLQCYSLAGTKRPCSVNAGACRLAAVSYDGNAFLTDDLSGAGATLSQLHLWDAGGSHGTNALESAPVGLALGATGEEAAVALADGHVLALRKG
jgi:WD40 repeat protein